ncbi:hypothetical protein HJG60_008439 [Phyllostomus discolor]|uniref:Uncharacterized protein n=1 Tax=Phyllostomus discolor TaxID=89673 RepID=A0A833Z308_9CHIR|nr:hypothetical protein HJG60_008439 [Phyllostomus discolor]
MRTQQSLHKGCLLQAAWGRACPRVTAGSHGVRARSHLLLSLGPFQQKTICITHAFGLVRPVGTGVATVAVTVAVRDTPWRPRSARVLCPPSGNLSHSAPCFHTGQHRFRPCFSLDLTLLLEMQGGHSETRCVEGSSRR